MSPTPPTLSPQMNRVDGQSPELRTNGSDSQSLKDLDLEENIDPTIPDATEWTYDEVYNYFVQYFPEEAKVFKEQVNLKPMTIAAWFIYCVSFVQRKLTEDLCY